MDNPLHCDIFFPSWKFGNLGIVDGKNEEETIDRVRNIASSSKVESGLTWNQGCALKRKQGKMYGNNFIADMRQDLVDRFMVGRRGQE